MTRCIFTGVGAEYSLAPLAAHLRTQGVECVELDMMSMPLASLPRPRERETVLVTSCHPAIDAVAYREFFGVDAPVSAVPQQLAYLRPKRACYVPHDLSDPLSADEVAFAPLFDALLMPDAGWSWLSPYVEVYDAGWIKAVPGAAERGGTLFLPSDIGFYASLGADAFVQRFAPILRHRPRVKLPRFAGSAAIEEALLRAGAEVLPASQDAAALIAGAGRVVSSGLSSVVAEAALSGAETICLADGVHPPAKQRATFERFPGVRILSIDAAGAELGRAPRTAAGRSRPFDFTLATRVILA